MSVYRSITVHSGSYGNVNTTPVTVYDGAPLIYVHIHASAYLYPSRHILTRNILDCDQSNVLLAHLVGSPWGVSYR